jgi:hypothetical protein
MFKEPDEPSMFDEIQTVVFARPDKIGKVFRVLNENLRLCLICDDVFTRKGAAEHAQLACYPRTKESEEDEGTLDPCSPCHLGKAGEILPDILDGN